MRYHEITYLKPSTLFSQFAKQPYAIWLDSSQYHQELGRYSFIAVDPFLTLQSKNGLITVNNNSFTGNPFKTLDQLIKRYPLQTIKGLPPFQGGVAGYFSYDLHQHLEDIPMHPIDDVNAADMMVGFYDLVIGFDHLDQRAWIFSSGYPETNTANRQQRAKQRLAWLQQQFCNSNGLLRSARNDEKNNSLNRPIVSNFTQADYEDAIKNTIDYIYAGDIFQANIAQRFSTLLRDDTTAFKLYLALRKNNPAPFSAFLNFPELTIASSSPERFLKLTDNLVETRPIKGTRKRVSDADNDKQLAEELIQSEKDNAENTMIVDLMRNDLSRVCKPGSINVPQLCGLESYETVHHLVSVVTGLLKSNISSVDLLSACFPGGSITGAPKIRAMEIIAELESQQRGPYCGSIGYLGFDQTMDTSIVIRTFIIKNQQIYYHAGGGIVADSDPHDEFLETHTKARALEKTLLGK